LATADLEVPRLDHRLKAVARQIRSTTHADIGSDHGHLLKALLKAGRIERGIAVENKQLPLQNSRATLTGLNAEVRFGDGLEPLRRCEVDSLSICGMGGESMVRILNAFPPRVPPIVVLQPNKRADLVRRWGLQHGFHLADERVADGHWPYQVLAFARSDTLEDPAYAGVEYEAALLFGPLIIKRGQPDFTGRLLEEQRYLRNLNRLGERSRHRLAVIDRLLAFLVAGFARIRGSHSW
jgi:tRNA (adenine22-N1)-methyltransferase